MIRVFTFLLCSSFCSLAWCHSTIDFIPNQGQVADEKGAVLSNIFFSAGQGNINLYFTSEGVQFYSWEIIREENEASRKAKAEGDLAHAEVLESRKKTYRFDLVFEGANVDVQPKAEGKLSHHSNYFFPHCPDGIMEVPHFESIIYENIYDQIDLVFYSNENGLKYDFIIHPGGNVGDIKMKYEGVDGISSQQDGSLVIKTPFENMMDKAPVAWIPQDEKGEKEMVECGFTVKRNIVSFRAKDAPKHETLIIDPTLYWGTYFAALGTTWDGGAVSSNGDFYATAYQWSSNAGSVPLMNAGTYYDGSAEGFTDLVIFKFNNSGQQLWTTYYGGDGGDFILLNTTVVDNNNNLYIGGETQSSNFPVQNPGGGAYYQGTRASNNDAFILKFNSSGSRLWATHFGGTSGERIRGINVDASNNFYVVGEAYSTNLPTTSSGSAYYQSSHGGQQDAFISRFSSSGALQWSTFYGGSGSEDFHEVVFDASNNMYLAGEISGWSTPTTYPVLTNPGGGAYYDNSVNGKQDLLIVKMNSSRQIVWSTIYGGQYNDNINGDCGSIAVDGSNNIYIVGKTMSDNLPRQNPGSGAYYQGTIGGGVGDVENDGFILKFNSSGVRQWATFYGGSSSEEIRKVVTDLDNNVWAGGYTLSSNIPLQTQSGSFNETSGGGGDGLSVQFTQGGVREWATCVGGSSFENIRPFDIFQNSPCGAEIFAAGNSQGSGLTMQNPGGGAYYQSYTSGNSTFLTKFIDGAATGSGTGTIWTWTGAIDTDWFEPCNWDRGTVPDCDSDVLIPNTSNKPYIGSSQAVCNTIEINSSAGARLDLNSSGGGSLKIKVVTGSCP